MRRADLPDICSRTLFVKCAERIQDLENREELLAHKDEVETLAEEYVNAAKKRLLAEISPATIFWNVPKETWKNLYKSQMSRPKGRARDEYDIIIAKGSGKLCPYCSVTPVKTVDHFLPQSKFPQYTVLPANLVGACSDCNKEKDATSSEALTDQFFHPYFESVGGRWLKVEVHEERPACVTYQVEGGTGLDGVTEIRAENQFRKLKLGPLYASLAVDELASYEWVFNELRNKGGPNELRLHLENQVKSFHEAIYPVEWKVALYEGLAESEWFCEGGFKFH